MFRNLCTGIDFELLCRWISERAGALRELLGSNLL